MKENIKLYIADKEVQFKSEPEIYYNYSQTDLQNPTIVKNSYSKTITIEGTPENNKIFGQFWDLERIQNYTNGRYSGSYFNPSHKTPFTLYVNGEIYESGYVKLDEVRKNKEVVEYDVTLYGGLGEFFYLLSFNENGDKLKLSDLNYTTSGGDAEFDFTIKKETVNDAWNRVGSQTGTKNKWDYINFAPCYNGNPDGLSADKVLINFNNNILTSAITSGGTSYKTVQGYAIGTLPAEVDEWVVRDLRSWNQRPVIRMKEIIMACASYAAKEGYSIDYDQSFFRNTNPYWEDSWLTLPKLDEIKIKGESEETSSTFVPTRGSAMLYNGWYDTTIMMNGINAPVGTEQIKLDMIPVFSCSSTGVSGYNTISSQTVYSSTYVKQERNFNGFLIQLIGYDGADYNSNIVAASDAVFITSKVGNEYLDIQSEVARIGGWYVKLNKSYSNVFGTFIPIGDGTYRFSSNISLTMDNTSKVQSYAVRILCLANLEEITTYNGQKAYTYGYRRGKFYTSTQLNSIVTSGTGINTITLQTNPNTFLNQASGNTYAGTDTAGYSGAKLTKKLLLDTESSPADYLLSYAKLFGLYFYKNPYDKVIHIATRNTFYRTGTTINIQDKIDRGTDMKVTPIAFDSKWYDMKFENVESEFSEKYYNTYGRPYGIHKINTGYNFDSDSKDLYENSSYKGAIECTEKSRYYVSPFDYSGYTRVPYYYYQGMTYELYNNSGDTIEITPTQTYFNAQPLFERKYYDAFSKPQLRKSSFETIDGQNILLLYSGRVNITNPEGYQINYYLTDDLPIMGNLNDGQACWLSTESIYNSGGTQIAISRTSIPHFGRYLSKNGYLLNSFDFGDPKELFIPDAVLRNNSSLYYNYWKDYISDIYDVNTKVLECNVLLENKPSVEWMRDFYWFDNAIWRINKISDWKIGAIEPTKVEFIKVQDKASYTLTPVSKVATITLSANVEHIPLSGGTIQFMVTVSDGSSWRGTSTWRSVGGVTPPAGTGDTVFNFHIMSYSGYQRKISLSVMGENGQYSNSVIIGQYDDYIGLEPNYITASPSGETGIITVSSNTQWTAYCSQSWVHLQSSENSVEYTVDANTSPYSRNASIEFSGGTTYNICVLYQNID